MKPIFKRMLSGVLSAVMTVSAVPIVSAHAEESAEPYPYTMFAASNSDGAITINANNVCVNGNIATNGTIVTTSPNFNVNGIKTENANEGMLYIQKKLNYSYFSGDNVETYTEDYILENLNININNPIDVNGTIDLTGNINLNSGIKATDDVTINGEVKNSNNAVICSETGDITIKTSNVGFNGLIYAPYGDIVIYSDNLNLNNVVIIGQTIMIDCLNVNANYNSEMGQLIGTKSSDTVSDPPEIITPDDPTEAENGLFCLDASYNVESNLLDIDVLFCPSDKSIILESDNNKKYSELATLYGTSKYAFTVYDDFTTKYLKATAVDKDGNIVETASIVVEKDSKGIHIGYVDSDSDGLTDLTENLLGTDPFNIDTDHDGLSDWEEMNLTGTDPRKFDSDGDGISDGDKDPDNDNLTNVNEIKYNCDPKSADTDNDGLNDGDEVLKYGTNPTLYDTDGDTLSDGFEVKYGLSPLSDETDGIKDVERKIDQTITSDSKVFENVNTNDNAYSMTIKLTANGDAEYAVSVSKSGNAASYETDAQIGQMTNITFAEDFAPESVRLEYDIKAVYRGNTLNKYNEYEDMQGIKRLNVFKLFEEIGMMLPVETNYDVENNIVYANIDGEGTYCIMDMEIWFDLYDLELDEIEKSTPVPMNMPSSVKRLASATTSDEPAQKSKAPLDLVFVLQTAGPSFAKNTYDMELNIMDTVAQYCIDNYEDVRIYVIEYKYHEAKIVQYRSNMDYFTNVSALSKCTRQLEYTYLSNSDYCETKYPFNILKNDIKFRNNVNRYIYHLHNGSNWYEYGTTDGISVCQKKIGIFSQIIPTNYRFHSSDYEKDLHDAIIGNKGIDIRCTNTTADEIITHIGEKLNPNLIRTDYNAILASNLTKITLDAPLKKNGTINSDSDTCTDWEETMNDFIKFDSNGNAVLPTIKELSSVIDSSILLKPAGNIGLAKNAMYAAIMNRTVLPCKSDPTRGDSDYDGILDNDDLKPFEVFDHLFEVTNYNNTEPIDIYPINLKNQLDELNKLHGFDFPTSLTKFEDMTLLDSLFSEIGVFALPTAAIIADLTNLPGKILDEDGGYMPNASKFLLHYCGNSGTDLNFDADEPIACTAAGREIFNKTMNRLIAEAEATLADGATVCVSTRANRNLYSAEEVDYLLVNFYNYSNPMEFDWDYSIGCGTTGIVAEITRNGHEYTMKFKYCIFDLYDWDKEQEASLYYLNCKGKAKCFKSIGVYEDSFKWIRGNRFIPVTSGSLDSIYELEYAQIWMLSLDHLESLYLRKKFTNPEAFI